MALLSHTRLGPVLAILLGLGMVACTKSRQLTITSEPSGALIRLDEDVIGTTPLEYSFRDFGKRRLSLYLAGYQSYSEPLELKAPWHARFPIDVFTEVLFPFGWRYQRSVHVALEPDDGQRVLESLDTFVKRAESLRRNAPISTSSPEAAEDNAGEGQEAPGDAPEETHSDSNPNSRNPWNRRE